MKLKDAYVLVSRHADTIGQSIDVTEASRVLAVYHSLLASLPASDAFDLVGKGIAEAEKKKGDKWAALRRKLKRSV